MILAIVLLIIAYFCFVRDKHDSLLPFGAVHEKNRKYANGLKGEEYGVGTFWGKPSHKDSVIDSLNKIQWISGTCLTDVRWRRSLIVAIVSALFIIFVLDFQMIKNNTLIVFFVLLLFNIIYFTTNWYVHHVLQRRVKFINTHIRKLKRKLRLTQRNKIYENSLI